MRALVQFQNSMCLYGRFAVEERNLRTGAGFMNQLHRRLAPRVMLISSIPGVYVRLTVDQKAVPVVELS